MTIAAHFAAAIALALAATPQPSDPPAFGPEVADDHTAIVHAIYPTDDDTYDWDEHLAEVERAGQEYMDSLTDDERAEHEEGMYPDYEAYYSGQSPQPRLPRAGA